MATDVKPDEPKGGEAKFDGSFADENNAGSWIWRSKGVVSAGGKSEPALLNIFPPIGNTCIQRAAEKQADGTVKVTTKIGTFDLNGTITDLEEMPPSGHGTYDSIINNAVDLAQKAIAEETPPANGSPAAAAPVTAAPAPAEGSPHPVRVIPLTSPPAAPAPAAPAAPAPAPAAPPPRHKAGGKPAQANARTALQPSQHYSHPDEIVYFEGGSLYLKRDPKGRPAYDANGKRIVSTDAHTSVQDMLSGPKREAALAKLDQLMADPNTSPQARGNYWVMCKRLQELPEAVSPAELHRGGHRQMGADAAPAGQPAVKGPLPRPLPNERSRAPVLRQEAPDVNPLDVVSDFFDGVVQGVAQAGVVVERGGHHGHSWPHGGRFGGGRGGPHNGF